MCESDYYDCCLEAVSEIKGKCLNRRIWIYGAGKGGQILYKVLTSCGVTVTGFVDRNEVDRHNFLEHPVVSIKTLSAKKDFLAISLMQFDISAYRTVIGAGFTFNDFTCVVKVIAELNRKDSVYKGIAIGRYTYGYKTLLEEVDSAAVLSIGRYCSINPSARIYENHILDMVTTHVFAYVPIENIDINFQDNYERIKDWFVENYTSKIMIGNDVWIGGNSIILPHVSIGDGAVIGAGAVVTKDVAPYEIVGGVPARRIRFRMREEVIEKMLEIRWWDWPHEAIVENFASFRTPELFVEKFYKSNRQ